MIPRLGLLFVLLSAWSSPGQAEPRHGIAMLGDPAQKNRGANLHL